MMTKLTATAVMAGMLVASGCKPQSADEARRALPVASALSIKLPGTAAAAGPSAHGGVGASSEAVLGQTAEFYNFTRGVTGVLNGGSAIVLILVHQITRYPVTSVEGDTYIWGPWNGDGLQPSQYRLTVTGDGLGNFTWSLEGRHKADGASAPYLSVVNGVATPGATEGHGSGTFSMNFDNAEILDPAGNDAKGTIDVTYDLESSPRTIVIDHSEPAEVGTGTDSFHYEYAENVDGSGDFQFALHDNVDHDTSSLEDATVRTRWLADGEGRSDIRLSGGDFGTLQVSGSECWDTSYGRVYWSDSVGFQPTEGDPAACAFSSAQYAGD